MIALINYPTKWIWPKLTIALGNGRNNRTASNQRPGPKGKGINQSGDSVQPGYLRFEDRVGSEQEGEEARRCGSTKQKRANS